MIIVRVELHSAITGKVLELARMHIINRGDGTKSLGNYIVRTLRGRSKTALDKGGISRNGTITGYPRLRLHVWSLVTKALLSTNYDKDLKP